MKTEMHLLLVLLVCAWGLQAIESATLGYNTTIKASTNQIIVNVEDFAKPGCQTQCGDLKVAYPFGIIAQGHKGPACSMHSGFDITCNNSTNPPKTFIKDWKMEIFNISDREVRVSTFVAQKCYDQSGSVHQPFYAEVDLSGTTYTFSDANVFTVVGCDEYAFIQNKWTHLFSGCSTKCQNRDEVPKGECSGTGCCQVFVKVAKFFVAYLRSYSNHKTNNISSFDPCGYAFLGEKNKFHFKGRSDLRDRDFRMRTKATVPIVLDGVIEENKTCAQAAQDSSSYACRYANSFCNDTDARSGGYRCSCKPGYEGNPYLSPGCQDIDECADPTKNDCMNTCSNIPGNYTCSCPSGHDGDGRKNGSGCFDKDDIPATPMKTGPNFPLFKFILGGCYY